MNIVTLDDSRKVSIATARFLRSLGHNVTNRLKPHEAMIALSTGWADVFVCDWDLGSQNQTGDKIIESVKTLWPEIRCVLYTGETNPMVGCSKTPDFVVSKGNLIGLEEACSRER